MGYRTRPGDEGYVSYTCLYNYQQHGAVQSIEGRGFCRTLYGTSTAPWAEFKGCRTNKVKLTPPTKPLSRQGSRRRSGLIVIALVLRPSDGVPGAYRSIPSYSSKVAYCRRGGAYRVTASRGLEVNILTMSHSCIYEGSHSFLMTVISIMPTVRRKGCVTDGKKICERPLNDAGETRFLVGATSARRTRVAARLLQLRLGLSGHETKK